MLRIRHFDDLKHIQNVRKKIHQFSEKIFLNGTLRKENINFQMDMIIKSGSNTIYTIFRTTINILKYLRCQAFTNHIEVTIMEGKLTFPSSIYLYIEKMDPIETRQSMLEEPSSGSKHTTYFP